MYISVTFIKMAWIIMYVIYSNLRRLNIGTKIGVCVIFGEEVAFVRAYKGVKNTEKICTRDIYIGTGMLIIVWFVGILYLHMSYIFRIFLYTTS